MVYTYGITQQGIAHKNRNLICQDAHYISMSEDGWSVVAVADGLGSELYSDIASKVASTEAVEYCVTHLSEEKTDEEVLEVLKESYQYALDKVNLRADDDGNDVNEYDTTLCLCAYKEGTLFYGQSGDSGAIVYTADGMFSSLTTQQRDSEARVFPLCFGEEKWVFGKCDKKVASVLLATDGIYDTFFPVYIKNEEVNIHVALADYFMNKDKLQIEEVGQENVKEKVEKYIDRIPENAVDDDKTLVVLIDTSIEVNRQQDEYYAELNWRELIEKYQREYAKLAYPDMDKKEN